MLDPATWTRSRARVVSLLVLGGVAFLALAALLAWTLAPATGATVAWILLIPVALLLVVELVVIVRAPRPEPRAADASRAQLQPAGPDFHRAEPPVLRETLLRLRCGHCGTVFEVPDTGERPLRHTCPGCGIEAVVA